MSKEITKASILQEIQNKFKLRDFEPEKFLFSEMVTPTYDIGDHVKHWESERCREQITANGVTIMCTVPENERWRVRKIDVINEGGANFKINQVFFYGSATKLQYLYFNNAGIASGAVEFFPLEQDIFMEHDEMNTLQLNVIDFVAGGYVAVHVLKEVETIR